MYLKYPHIFSELRLTKPRICKRNVSRAIWVQVYMRNTMIAYGKTEIYNWKWHQLHPVWHRQLIWDTTLFEPMPSAWMWTTIIYMPWLRDTYCNTWANKMTSSAAWQSILDKIYPRTSSFQPNLNYELGIVNEYSSIKLERISSMEKNVQNGILSRVHRSKSDKIMTRMARA